MRSIIVMLCGTVGLSILIGILRYFLFSTRSNNQQSLSYEWTDHIDVDIPDLSIENAESDLVSKQVVSMRGSWRLAQGRTLSSLRFEDLRAEEYSKKL